MANPAPGFRQRPEHTITVTPYKGRVTVSVGGTGIADTTNALSLKEASYPAVFYVPFEDIDFLILSKAAKSTHCPFKGNASYWDIATSGATLEAAVWAYETPYDEMQKIAGHAAFYADKTTIEATPA